MKNKVKLSVVGAFALLLAIPALAQTPEASILPVTERLDVGGTILEPGTYLIRVLPSTTDRNKVQITSQDRSKVYATVLTVPHTLEPNEEIPNTTFVFYPPEEGMPRALRTWFAPDPEASGGGHDIVYDDRRARQLARLVNEPVPSYPATTPVEQLDTAPVAVVTPEPAPVVTTPAPAPVVEVETPAPAPVTTPEPEPMMSSEPAPVQTADTQPMEMPRTASNVPLMALLGLGALGAAVTLRARS
jgi:hypothetical protein